MLNDGNFIKIGLSDNNEYGHIMFCVRTYLENKPCRKVYFEEFDDAVDHANKTSPNRDAIEINVRAQRHAKKVILQRRKDRMHPDNQEVAAPEPVAAKSR